MLAACCVIRLTALENAAASAKATARIMFSAPWCGLLNHCPAEWNNRGGCPCLGALCPGRSACLVVVAAASGPGSAGLGRRAAGLCGGGAVWCHGARAQGGSARLG